MDQNEAKAKCQQANELFRAVTMDTDGDGISDGLEVYIKTNPLDAVDFTPIGESCDPFYNEIRLR
jgi:Bacterial TSP3 repeat